jgi:hypothetical protein
VDRSNIKQTLSLAALLIAAPALCLPAAITANTVCEVGTCGSPGTLAPGMSIPSTPYSFVFTFADTDTYSVSGTYSASGTAPSITFSAAATYLGNATHTASSADVLSVDLLENFSYTGPTGGTYSESATLSQSNVAAGSNVTAQLFFGGAGIGLLGPFTGSGSQTYSASASLTPSNPTLADFNYTFTIAAGTQATPEPGSAALMAFGLCLATFGVRAGAKRVKT